MAEQNPPSTRVLSRSRGAASGILLVLLGAWGALAPFIGPTFTFAFTPDKSWHWTAARGWYEVAPGAAAFVGGLLLLFARSRAITVLGAWLGILAGAWFIVGPAISSEVTLGSLGQPIGSSSGQRVAETLTFFYGLGAVILFLAAVAFGRLSVVTVRDLRIAERRESERREREADENDRLEHERLEQERYERGGYDRESPGSTGNSGFFAQNQNDDPAPTSTLPPAEDETRNYSTRDQSTGDYSTRDDPGADTQVFDQRSSDQPPGTTGYHSALGYREGEQPSPYSTPTYGRHDANVRGTTTSTAETQGPPASTGNPDQTTREQPR